MDERAYERTPLNPAAQLLTQAQTDIKIEIKNGVLAGAPFSVTPDYLIQCQFSTTMVRSSRSCFSLGIELKKSSPVRSSTRSTVTTKVRRSALLPLFGSTKPIIFSGGVVS